MPDFEPRSLEQRVQAALEGSRKAAMELVFTEVALGLTFCRIANSVPTTDKRYSAGLQSAKTALEVANKYMWKLKMDHPHLRSDDGTNRTPAI